MQFLLQRLALFQDAEASGSAHMDRLAQVGARRVDNLAGHMDVLQRLNVNRHWPAQYVLQAPLWNHREQRRTGRHRHVAPSRAPVLLRGQSSSSFESPESGCFARAGTRVPRSSCLLASGRPQRSHPCWPMGGWNLSMNVLSCKTRCDTRFPLCIVQKHLIVKNETWNRVLDVVSWSFRFVSLQQVCFRYVDTMARRGMLQTTIVPVCKDPHVLELS